MEVSLLLGCFYASGGMEIAVGTVYPWISRDTALPCPYKGIAHRTRTRQCHVPTQNNIVGTRHCLGLISANNNFDATGFYMMCPSAPKAVKSHQLVTGDPIGNNLQIKVV